MSQAAPKGTTAERAVSCLEDLVLAHGLVPRIAHPDAKHPLHELSPTTALKKHRIATGALLRRGPYTSVDDVLADAIGRLSSRYTAAVHQGTVAAINEVLATYVPDRDDRDATLAKAIRLAGDLAIREMAGSREWLLGFADRVLKATHPEPAVASAVPQELQATYATLADTLGYRFKSSGGLRYFAQLVATVSESFALLAIAHTKPPPKIKHTNPVTGDLESWSPFSITVYALMTAYTVKI